MPSNVRIVIDTNVIVSAIVFGGKPRKVVDLIADDVVTLVAAEEMLTEARRIIVSKFPDFLGDLEKVAKLFELECVWVKLGLATVAVSRDPDDDKFIEAALVGSCQYVVSGDKDLLDLESYKEIKIINPAEFLEVFGIS